MGPFLHTGEVFVAQFVHSCMTLVVVAFSSFFKVEIEFVCCCCCCCCAGGENSFRLCFDISPQLSAVSDDTMLSVLSRLKMFFTQLSVLSCLLSASKDKLNFKLCAIFCCLCGFYVSFLLELLGWCSNRRLCFGCLLLALQNTVFRKLNSMLLVVVVLADCVLFVLFNCFGGFCSSTGGFIEVLTNTILHPPISVR